MEQKRNEQETRKIAEQLLKTINDIEGVENAERKVKDNKILFKVAGKVYRVRRPTYEEQMEAEKFRRKKYIEFVNDKTMMFRKQWVKIYKEKGIDINQMEAEMSTLQAKIELVLLRLAKIQNEKDVKKLRDEVLTLRTKQAEINIEKTDLLSYSIEDQLMITINSYYAYMLLEEQDKENDKWIRVFKTYEDFSNSQDSDLINKTFYHTNYLIYTTRI